MVIPKQAVYFELHLVYEVEQREEEIRMRNFPNNIEQLTIENDFGVKLFVLRDDLFHPFISGNKWRKLAGIILKAKELNAKELISYGGAYSNHLLALACAGASNGFKTQGIIRGEEVHQHVTMLCQQWGMKLTFLNREKYSKQRMLGEECGLYFEDSRLYIPEGGACEEAYLGFRGIAESGDWDEIWVAAGTGTTAIGLSQYYKPTAIKAVGCVKDQSMHQKLMAAGITVVEGHEFGGFGKFDSDLLSLSRAFTSKTGILLDPIYTAKLWHALLSHLEHGKIKEGSSVLMIHSGGLTGWLSEKALKTSKQLDLTL